MSLLNQIQDVNTEQLVNMTEVQTGGGARGLLPTGTAIVRLSTYIEFGKHIKTFQGQAKPATPQFKLGFCIVGGGGTNKDGKGEKYVREEGQFPFISTFDIAMSQHIKSTAVKIFKALNRVGEPKTHFVQKVAEQCLYSLPVSVEKDNNGNDRNVYDFTQLNVAVNPATYEAYTDADMPTLEDKHIQVFLWGHPTKEMWDSIHIEGEWEAKKDANGVVTKPAKSKNFLQEKCLSAVNFEGSALQLLLQEQDVAYTIPELPTTPDTVPEAPETPVQEVAEGSVAQAPEMSDDDLG